jgi:transcription termination/antitermination protein NusG
MDKQWYVIRTHVGDEQRVKAALQQKIREWGQDEAFGEVVGPSDVGWTRLPASRSRLTMNAGRMAWCHPSANSLGRN